MTGIMAKVKAVASLQDGSNDLDTMTVSVVRDLIALRTATTA
jgi:hypothetical protein